ncbi:uncharacterized protein LOC133798752 [Humulus lupulus]|uniref:uncharacterized protein LOC133798752 n=1 Tax=Humulus lupulus TaxID=3486 RepID=UPI002B40177B|nr:uncharacterized protein LOC133798752 [Humulus lupulus]XP_062093215.1 uncharacterized protein LOC133798752 [Humulus lupulus]XP_062093224.1 uncharacterized protein LOC133798752 [Humulus lupulus]XP_062093230.1 uncharacterized protein LOC133798752 [Humulus lupulus]
MLRRSKRLWKIQDDELLRDDVERRVTQKDPPPPKHGGRPEESLPPREEKEESSPTIRPDGGHLELPVHSLHRPPVAPRSGHQDPGPSTHGPSKSPGVRSVSSSSRTCLYWDEIQELHKKTRRLETQIENMQEVLNDLLRGKSSTPPPVRKWKEHEKGESTVLVDDGGTQLSTSKTPQTKYQGGPRPTKGPQEQRRRVGDGRKKEVEVPSKEAPPGLRKELHGERSEVRDVPPAVPPRDTTKARDQPETPQNSLCKKRRGLDTKMQSPSGKITTALGGRMDDGEFDRDSPFTREIQAEQMPTSFKEPRMTPYEGTTDPKYHLDSFNNVMRLRGVNSRAKCHCFVVTLKGVAYKWFRRLRQGTIKSWQQFSDEFLQQHHGACDYIMPTTNLANIKQGENESLKDYIHRFGIEATKVGDLTKAELKMAITAGVRPGSKLWSNMLKREVLNLDDFFERAQKYIRVEEGH